MKGLRVLFVDDDKESVRSAMEWVKGTLGSACKQVDFDQLDDAADEFLPHVVVLDRMKGLADDQGQPSFERVWNKRFCPVVIFTAFPEGESLHELHPEMVKLAKKGADQTPFESAMTEILPVAGVLAEAEKYIRDCLGDVLRDVVGYVFKEFTEVRERIDALQRSGRRRLAALSDHALAPGKALAPWEQYIFPPLHTHSLLGDVIQVEGQENATPESFRVVLTPSCDMVPRVATGTPKVNEVLLARCCSNLTGCTRAGVGKPSDKEFRSTFLTAGHYSGLVPLPPLKGRIPPMMVDLKRLELVPWEELNAVPPTKYRRVASMDSPFRELISWAFIQMEGRPGLPDRDFGEWLEAFRLESHA